MSDSTETRALHKQVLLARSRLHRLKLHNEMGDLRESLRWTRVAKAAVGNVTRMFSATSRAMIYARIALSMVNLLRGRPRR
jgi:hypothetical protein